MPPERSDALRPSEDARRTDPQPNAERRRVLFGICLVIASTLCFSVSDVTAKLLTATLPPFEVVWLRYLVFCVLVVHLHS